MVISFFGHRDLIETEAVENLLINFMEENLKFERINFYLGGYGRFDSIAKKCCQKFKAKHSGVRLCFITPYIKDSYLTKRKDYASEYDEIIYPNLENTLPQYAILKRNKWMVDNSDFTIFYVKYNWGGACKILDYAKRKNKNFINIYETKKHNLF